MEIYVANLDRGIDEGDLKETFETYGEVISAVLIRDKETRNSKGYGFIKMFNSVDGERAIDDLHGREIAGRTLVVKVAKPQEERNSFQSSENRPQRSNYNSRWDSDDYVSVKFEEERPQEEDLPMKVQDEAEFTKTSLEDGLIKISFN